MAYSRINRYLMYQIQCTMNSCTIFFSALLCPVKQCVIILRETNACVLRNAFPSVLHLSATI